MSEDTKNPVEDEKKDATDSPKKEEKKKDNSEMENIIMARVRKEQVKADKEKAVLRAEIEELKAQGNPNIDPPVEGAQPLEGQAPETIPVAELPGIIDYVQQEQNAQKQGDNFKNKFQTARDADPELEELAKNGNSIPWQYQQNMVHLENSPAVLKHLLKDNKDHQLMIAAGSEGAASLVKMLNDLSTRLENADKGPRPPDYTPSANMSHLGESEQDFDMDEYVKSKP